MITLLIFSWFLSRQHSRVVNAVLDSLGRKQVMREPQPAMPRPDRVSFSYDDYAMPVLGLCADCLKEACSSSARIRVRDLRGIARDVINCTIRTPAGFAIEWHDGVELPAGADWLVEIARLFGPGRVKFGYNGGIPLPVFAVTYVEGRLVCPVHLAEAGTGF